MIAMTSKAIVSGHKTDLDTFVDQAKKIVPQAKQGKLMFALDATASRQPTWDLASTIQAEMFQTVGDFGGLSVQLVYYRGYDECRASRWVNDPKDLVRLMQRVHCIAGATQISRILRHALNEIEKGPVRALVFIGDCVEESADRLVNLSGQLGLRGVKLFMFQEGHDPHVAATFQQMAKATRGAHCQFDRNAPNQLRDLIVAVAAYATGGHEALRNLARTRRGQFRLIAHQIS